MAELRERGERGELPPVLLVHMGSPEEGERFLRERWPEARAVSDPGKRLYAAFGLRRGSAAQLFGPASFRAGFAAALRGHGIGRPVGDPWMMSGWFLVHAGRMLWSQVHERPGEPRRYEELRAAAARALEEERA